MHEEEFLDMLANGTVPEEIEPPGTPVDWELELLINGGEISDSARKRIESIEFEQLLIEKMLLGWLFDGTLYRDNTGCCIRALVSLQPEEMFQA